MLSILVSGWDWPANVRWTRAAMRKALGGLTFSLSGAISTGDISPGSITPALVSPGAYFYGTTTYAAKTYTLGLSPVLTALSNGVRVAFKASAECEDGAINLIVNGLGPKKILRGAGVGLVAGDIRVNQIVEVTYNSSLDSGSGAWEITSLIGNPEVFSGTAQAGSTGSAHVVTSTVPAKSLAALAWRKVLYVATVENTGAITLALDGLTAKSILKDDGRPLGSGEIKSGDLVNLHYVPTMNAGAGAFVLKSTRSRIFFASDAGASDTYAATVDGFPAVWVSGLMVILRANTANTGASTLNITPSGGAAVGAKAIVKSVNKATETGDILAGQYISLVYDGTNLQMVGGGSSNLITSITFPAPVAGAQVSFSHGLGAFPRYVRWVLLCNTNDGGFLAGEETDISYFVNNTGGNPYPQAFASVTTITDCALKHINQVNGITVSNWSVRCYHGP